MTAFGGTTEVVTDIQVGDFSTNLLLSRVQLPPANVPGFTSLSERGWLGGGFFGVQRQWGNWVLGLETDIDVTSIQGSSDRIISGTQLLPAAVIRRSEFVFDGTVRETTVVSFSNAATVTQVVSVSSKIEELVTLRGKVGFVPWQNTMIYGTAGPAWGRINTSFAATQTVSGTVLGTTFGTFPTLSPVANFSETQSIGGSSRSTLVGWSAGAGIDWKLTPNIILGALYLHYEFPKNTLQFADNVSGVVFGLGNSRQSVDAIKARLSWLIN